MGRGSKESRIISLHHFMKGATDSKITIQRIKHLLWSRLG
jgi:hypothetical protein